MSRCVVCQEEYAPGVFTCPRDGATLPQSLEGTVLGERYRVLRTLGEGGMGQVYLAEHVLLGKQVAVKVLRHDFSAKEDLVKRFQLEAVAASQIGQENIVDVTDFGQTPERSFYYVMEYVPGRSLGQLVDGAGPMPADRALPLFTQICKALAAAHARGIVHRDLKPDNVIVSRLADSSEKAKVLDFGISKVGEGPSGSRITQVGMVVGTPHYMAPEQAVGSDVDQRADIYAFGVLAYEVLTGKVPFDAENPVQVLLKHQSELPQPPSERAPVMAIPQAVEDLVLRCLEKRREDRPQDMAEVLRALDGCMVELGLSVGSASLALAASGRTDPAGMPVPPRREAAAARLPLPEVAVPVPGGAALPSGLTAELAHARFTDRRGYVVLGVLALLIGAVGVMLAFTGRAARESVEVVRPAQAPRSLQQALATPPPSPPVAAAAPVLARVMVSSVPGGARVLGANHQLLGQTPFTLQLAHGEQREVHLEVPGYRPASRVVGARDGSVEVKLERLPVPVRTPPAVHKGPAVSSPADDGYRKVDRDDIRNPYGN
jgi:tRNA A-37 threonylcarbamoyl transferase component Bud32